MLQSMGRTALGIKVRNDEMAYSLDIDMPIVYGEGECPPLPYVDGSNPAEVRSTRDLGLARFCTLSFCLVLCHEYILGPQFCENTIPEAITESVDNACVDLKHRR